MSDFKFNLHTLVRAIAPIKLHRTFLPIPAGAIGRVCDRSIEKSDGSRWYAVNFRWSADFTSMEEVPERLLGYETLLDDIVNGINET